MDNNTTTYGRPTMHNGTMYRSRLEAEFAAKLDLNKIVEAWGYEPCAFAAKTGGSYLPDFLVHFDTASLYIETKCDGADVHAALARMHAILDSEPDANIEVQVGTWADGGYTFRREAKCHTGDPCGKCSRFPDLTLAEMLVPRGGSIVELTCHCGNNYAHLEEVELRDGGTDGIRPGAVLRFSCEICGEGFALHVDNVKGATQLCFDRAGGIRWGEEQET